MIIAGQQIQSVSRSDGGSSPRDDLYSSECQRRSGHQMSPRDRSPVRTSSPRQPSGKDHWNQWSPYTLNLLQLEQTTGSSGQRGTGPLLSLVSPKVFFSVLSPMEFWFLAFVASGFLSWGHFISSDITDLIAQILFKLN